MNIAEIKKFKIINMLPSLLIVIIISYSFVWVSMQKNKNKL
jgi:uncharacterized membrane protein YqgA involved in biofilm formation